MCIKSLNQDFERLASGMGRLLRFLFPALRLLTPPSAPPRLQLPPPWLRWSTAPFLHGGLHVNMDLQGKMANDMKAWDAAIERAKSNLAHQLLRNTNADLQVSIAVVLWCLFFDSAAEYLYTLFLPASFHYSFPCSCGMRPTHTRCAALAIGPQNQNKANQPSFVSLPAGS